MDRKNPVQKEKATFDCMKCKFSCIEKKFLLKHLNKHKKGRPFKCLRCNFRGATRPAISDHTRLKHRPPKPVGCRIRKSKSSSKFLYKKYAHIEKIGALYKCHICEYSTRYKSILTIHEKIHQESREHICNFCQAWFKQRCNLEIHFRTHTGEKPFKCEFCKFEFAHNSNLRAHQKWERCKKNIHELFVTGHSLVGKATEKPTKRSSLRKVPNLKNASYSSTAGNSPTALETNPGQQPYEQIKEVKKVEKVNCRFVHKRKTVSVLERRQNAERCKQTAEFVLTCGVDQIHTEDEQHVPANINEPERPHIIDISQDSSSNDKWIPDESQKVAATYGVDPVHTEDIKHVPAGISKPEQPLIIHISQVSSSNDEWTSDASKNFGRCATSMLTSEPALLHRRRAENFSTGKNNSAECKKARKSKRNSMRLGSARRRCKEIDEVVSINRVDEIGTKYEDSECWTCETKEPVLIDISQDSSDEFPPEATNNSRLVTSKKISVPVLLPKEILENWIVGQNPYGPKVKIEPQSSTSERKSGNENTKMDELTNSSRSYESMWRNFYTSDDFSACKTSANEDEKMYSGTNIATIPRKYSDLMQETAMMVKIKPGRSFYSERNFACPECNFTCCREDRLLRHRLRNHF